MEASFSKNVSSDRGFIVPSPSKFGSGACQQPLDGFFCTVRFLGDLSCAPPFPVAPEQGQAVSLGHVRQDAVNAGFLLLSIHDLLKAGIFSSFGRVRLIVHWFRLPQPGSVMVFDFVPRDTHQPMPQRRVSLVAAQVFPCRQKDFLHYVVHEVGARNQPVTDVRVDVVRVGRDKLGTCLPILPKDSFYQFPILFSQFLSLLRRISGTTSEAQSFYPRSEPY